MADSRVTQERVTTATTQTSKGRVTQERVVAATIQTSLSKARVTQERLVIAYQPGVFTGIGNFAGQPAHSTFSSESFPGYAI